MQNCYVYPKLSKYDLMLFRVGPGGGLGNLLSIYMRAFLFAQNNNAKLIWPSWASFRIGPFIRNEKDKRTYIGLFKASAEYVTGINKVAILNLEKKCYIDDINQKTFESGENLAIYSAYSIGYSDILQYRQQIYDEYIRMLSDASKNAVKHDFSREVNVHIRRGDYTVGTEADLKAGHICYQTPTKWFVKAIEDLRKILPQDIVFNIFSDGTDEQIAEVLKLPNVRRVFYGNAAADLYALSKARLIVASGSTFSLWGRFFGNTACLSFKNQLFEKVCDDPDSEYDYDMDEQLSQVFIEKIQKIYQ